MLRRSLLLALALLTVPCAAAPKTKPNLSVRSLKVLAVIYRGAPDDAKRMDDAAVEGTRNGIALGRLFYFRNTKARLNLDITYRVFDSPVPNNDNASFDNIEKDLRARGVKDNQFDGIYATGVGTTGNWGGYRVFGKAGAAFGGTGPGTDLGWFPQRDPKTWYDTAWTFVHEFQHALDLTIASVSGHPEMLSDHPYSDFAEGYFTWGHHAGEHWDWVAHTLASFESYNDLSGATDTTILVVDADEDGFPDDDKRLPMDEKRFGSDTTKADTDGDGRSDLDEFAADIYLGSNPRETDSDKDGIPDGQDRNPTVALAESVTYSATAPVVDGRLEAAYRPLTTGVYLATAPAMESARTYAAWNEDGLSLFVKAPERVTLQMKVDTSAENGFWEGGDTYMIHAAPDGKVTFSGMNGGAEVPGAKAVWGDDGLEVFIPALIGQGLSGEANYGGARRPQDVADGLNLQAGRTVSFNLILSGEKEKALLTPQWTLFDTTLAKSPGDPSRPSLRFAPKLTREPEPMVMVTGIAPNDQVLVMDAARAIVGERVGSGPVYLTGLKDGMNRLVARAGGRDSSPVVLMLDTGALHPRIMRAGGQGAFQVSGEAGATVDIFAGLTSPVWPLGSVKLNTNGVAEFTRPDTGFLGAYARNSQFDTPLFYRVDPQVKFDYNDGTPDPRLPADGFGVRWTGYLRVPQDGEYTFYLATDDGGHLWVDGSKIIDNGGHHEKREKTATMRLTRGEHLLQMDYTEDYGWAAAHLEWSGPGIARTYAIPVAPVPAAGQATTLYARQTDPAGNVSLFGKL